MDEAIVLEKLNFIIAELKKLSDEVAQLSQGSKEYAGPPASRKPKKKAKAEQGRGPSVPRFKPVPEIMVDILANYGITVEAHKTESIVDSAKEKAAQFIGKNIAVLKERYPLLITQIISEREVVLEIDPDNEAEVYAWRQLFQLLEGMGAFISWHYEPELQYLSAVPGDLESTIRFLNNEWFIRYITKLISNAVRFDNGQMTFLFYPELQLETGDVLRVDLALLIDSEFHWAICTTDHYSIDLDVYTEIAEKLGTSKEQSHIFILGLDHEIAAQFSEEYGLTVANEDQVTEAFGLPTVAQVQIATTQQEAQYPENLRAFLNQHNLRPFPERRDLVLTNLLRLAKSLPAPIPLSEYKQILNEELGVSRTCIQDLLNAVVRSGSVLDAHGRELYSFNLEVGSFRYQTLEELQAQCRQSYCYVILKRFPNYFNFERNRKEFAEVVQLEPPTNAEILKVLTLISEAQDSLEE